MDDADPSRGNPPSKRARRLEASVEPFKPQMCADSSKEIPVFLQEMRLVGVDAEQVLFIELFAGSAVLSAAAKRRGYRIMPVDYKRNRHTAKCQIVQLDCSNDHAWQVLQYIVQSCKTICVHAAPPCDADKLNEHLGNFVKFLDSEGVAWVIENPTNSLLWNLAFFAYARQRGTFAHCHACAFGSSRDKKTSFLSNRPGIKCMQKFCHDVPPHEHVPWGHNETQDFSVSEDAQYPETMCQALVGFLDELCHEASITLQPENHSLPRLSKQARGRATPQLVPEYKQVVSLLLPVLPILNAKKCLEQPCKHVPVGSKMLRSEKRGNGFLCVFGIFHSIQEFTDSALQLWHPFDMAVHMPDAMLRCLFEYLTSSPVEVVKSRIRKLKLWTSWASELAGAEDALRSNMHPGVRSVLGNKRVQLMKKIAQHIAWPDMALFDELSKGFRIVGNATKSNVFSPGLKAASLSEQQLMSDSKFLRPALLGKIRSGGVGHLGAELMKVTLDEATNKAWLQGPMSVREVDEFFAGPWMPVRRFAIMQKKLRPIDDYKENRVNETFSNAEKATLYSLDHLVWALLALMRLCKKGGEFTYTLSDGTRLTGFVHAEWLRLQNDFKVTSLDLKSAYKQLPLNPCDYNKAVVSLWDAGCGDISCFVTKTLPFGASGSVRNFLRMSSFLHAAGSALGIVWSSYFDDFPMVSHALHVSSTMACAKGFLFLFGFSFAEDKLAPFAEQAEVLGIVLDLTECKSGVVRVVNKPSRVEDLKCALDDILEKRVVVPFKMPSVLGKLQYADSHVWGRAGRLALADLREIGHTSHETVKLSDSHLEALKVLRQRMCSGKPRVFVADSVSKPFLIFTDGALEYEGGRPVGTIGAVMMSPDGKKQVFGCKVPEALIALWRTSGKTHVIGLIELYACIVALTHWKPMVDSKRLIVFVDNWPALDVLVKGTSSQTDWRRLLLLLEDPDEDHFMMWVGRVPSASNVSDGPSRGALELLNFLRPFQVVVPECPVSHECLESLVKC